MQKSKWWIFLLLTSFTLLLVPRNIWHDCEQIHSKKNSSKTEYNIEKEHCNICDFQFYPSILNEHKVIWYSKIKYLKVSISKYELASTLKKLSATRGPPTDLF